MRGQLLLTGVALLAATLVIRAADAPVVSVHETSTGAFVVSARFTVAEGPDVAHTVLTDYANIPRFMPDVRASEIIERQDGLVRVAQEAVSEYLFFSKRVHLTLDVEEGTQSIRFRDRCNKSFHVYEGSWTVAPHEGGTELVYRLTAKPAFSVPGFVIRRLLNRDARVMIERLRTEIADRGGRILAGR